MILKNIVTFLQKSAGNCPDSAELEKIGQPLEFHIDIKGKSRYDEPETFDTYHDV